MTTPKELKCAIYTRKSCEDGLELEYNSLDAQYDAAASYIRSQAANGWALMPKHYDDGGFSGGNVNRPALKGLLADIEAGQVDIVVVYKADLGLCIEQCRSVGYKLIIIDAFYRAMPKDVDENDNGAVTSVYNLIDRYAQEIGCAFVLVHHTSKGNQSQKSVTDVGAGAGAQSRAADTHVILRRHKEKDVVVKDSVVRSFKSVPPICLRWSWPVWNPEPLCDPVELDGTKLSVQKRTATDEELVAPLVAYVGQFKTSKALRTAKFLKKAQDKFASYATKEVVKAALDEAIERGHLISERQKDAPRGQQSTRYLTPGGIPITDTERQLSFTAGISV